jgi:hypothetical protein
LKNALIGSKALINSKLSIFCDFTPYSFNIYNENNERVDLLSLLSQLKDNEYLNGQAFANQMPIRICA